jgi:hypothetical protein
MSGRLSAQLHAFYFKQNNFGPACADGFDTPTSSNNNLGYFLREDSDQYAASFAVSSERTRIQRDIFVNLRWSPCKVAVILVRFQ